jgi:hypothetical protein
MAQPAGSPAGDEGYVSGSVLAAVAGQVPGLSQEELKILSVEGAVTNLYTAPDRPRLAPGFSEQIREDLDSAEPRLGVEVLFLAPAPDGPAAGPLVFNTLQKISTMAGIEYYSQSRGRMRTLFYESYVIDDPDNRNRLPDPVSSVVPARDRLYVFQRDSSFGRNVYQLDYRVDGEIIFLTMTNLTRMLYQGFIPAVGPEQLVFHIIVEPIEDELLFYGNSAANAPTAFGIEDRIQMSFYNRIVALYNWFTGEVSSR